MAIDDETQSTILRWIDSLRDGDDKAAEVLWKRYFSQMVRLARQRLGHSPVTVRSEEDIALSAFKSFCLGVRRGRFQDVETVANLWAILVTLTLRKSVDQLRHQNRAKRAVRTSLVDQQRGPESIDIGLLAADQPTPEMLAMASDNFRHLIEELDSTGDPQLSLIALASLEGDTPQEIAGQLGCSVRTVQRKLKTVRALWEATS